MLGFEDREDAGLLREPGDADRVARRGAPAERAGDEDVHVARAAHPHRVLTLYSRSRRSAIVAVATYGISCAIAISGALLPWPNELPGASPTASVVAVRAAGGVAPERCTPVFM